MVSVDFGPLIVETDIDGAALSTLSLWMEVQLRDIEDKRGMARGYLPRPKDSAYRNTLTDDEFNDLNSFPAIVVTTAETTGDPITDGDGYYYAAWQLVVSAISRGRTPAETRGLAAMYGGAVKRIMLSQQDLGGLATELKWVRGNLAPVASPQSSEGRYLAASLNQFTVFVDKVVQEGVGPISPHPDESPYDPVDPDNPAEVFEPLADVRDVTFDFLARSPRSSQ